MKRASAFSAFLGLGGAVVWTACAAAPMRVAALDEVERVRISAAAQEGARLAPEAFAHAEQERQFAREAHAAADDVGATLYAQRAVAAYDHALIVARLARATTELADAQKALDDATTQEVPLDAARANLEREAEDVEERLRIARERLLPASSTAATPEREAARVIAARSLAMQARLLCAAARLVTPDAAGLADADGEVAALEQRPARGPQASTIDDAARTRAHCLDVLTRARRGAESDAGSADALLAELSAAGGWDPARDERGVTVTLRDVFRGAELTGSATARLKDLGRVAAAHPHFGLQVVVHDAQAPASVTNRTAVPTAGAPGNDSTDAKRAELAVQALLTGGVPAANVRAELAGARLPLVDPSDPKARGRNERLEVVFVGSRR